MITGPVIQLRGGVYLNLADPDYDIVQIEDVAHALAHICRYTGHVKKFYSVAQHCVIGSYFAKDALAFLLHDLTEFCLGDVSSPLKGLIPEYKKLEALHEERAAARFGVQYPYSDDTREVDMRMLATERYQLLTEDFAEWSVLVGVEPYDIKLPVWSPERAKAEYLSRYYLLAGESQLH